ncbi:MAG: hypothetical protein IJX76_06215 [Clostridia bacterium]|nr:hypothetical protein [Clostridia bacterium]
MNEINIKKMEELLSNEEFAQKIADAGSYENAYKLFIENDVAVTYEEFIGFINETGKTLKATGLISDGGEVGPELLDLVSGGGKGAAIFTWVVAGVAASVCPPAGFALWLAGGLVWNAK